MFTALVIDDDPIHSGLVRDALADAGCIDIDALCSYEAVLAFSTEAARRPDLVVMSLVDANTACLRDLAVRLVDVPILVLCSEDLLDAAFAAGAADCVTTPVRVRELAGRIREAMRARSEAARRATRERKMSDAIVALQREKQDLERLVCVDSLTGVANRRHALALLDAEWRRSAREHLPLGVVMIDLDCYHAYNEQYGHLGGDACLQRVTEAMVTCLRRPSDFLGRYGGEEFIAVLPNTDAVGAKIVAERLRAAVEALAIPHEASVCARVVTITAGFASFKVLGDLTVDKLIAAADTALLRAKAGGRNRIDGDAPLVRPTRISAQRWQRFAPVFADPWFADRIPGFLAEVHDEATGVLAALRTNADLGAIRVAAQVLRTTSQQFGFQLIGRLADELEQACAVENIAAMREAAEELVQYVTHVQVVYRRPIERPVVVPAARV